MKNFAFFKKLLWVSIFIFMFACATTDKHRHREGDNTGQETDITVADEKKMTAQVLPEMKKQYPPVKDKRLQAYISSNKKKLVRANKLEGNPYHYTFTVVDVEYVNAFALPAGTVFVTAPLIKMTENEAELAGVVGHEIGHVVARHTAERMYKAKKNKTKNMIYAAGGGILGGIAGFGIGKLVCKKGDTKCLAKAAGAGAVLGAGGTLLVQRYKFMANSREDEMEADRIGFRVATKAGYSKEHVGKFYEKLLKMEKKYSGKQNKIMRAVTDAMSTHPPSEERVKQMNEMARNSPAQKKPLISGKRYKVAKAIVARMVKKK